MASENSEARREMSAFCRGLCRCFDAVPPVALAGNDTMLSNAAADRDSMSRTTSARIAIDVVAGETANCFRTDR